MATRNRRPQIAYELRPAICGLRNTSDRDCCQLAGWRSLSSACRSRLWRQGDLEHVIDRRDLNQLDVGSHHFRELGQPLALRLGRRKVLMPPR